MRLSNSHGAFSVRCAAFARPSIATTFHAHYHPKPSLFKRSSTPPLISGQALPVCQYSPLFIDRGRRLPVMRSLLLLFLMR